MRPDAPRRATPIDCLAVASAAATEAVAAALDSLAFTPISPVAPPAADVPGDAVAVEMTIAGDDAFGRLSLLTSRALARRFAESVFAGDGPVTEEQAEDALREIGNIACGGAAQRLGTAAQGEMSLPRLRAASAAEWRAAAASESTSVADVGGSVVMIRLSFSAAPRAKAV